MRILDDQQHIRSLFLVSPNGRNKSVKFNHQKNVYMRSTIAFLFIFILGSSAFAQSTNQSVVKRMDSLISKLIQSKKSAGFMIGIKIQQQKPIFKQYGLANIATKKPVSPDQEFRIASVTKPITAVAVMTLVEKGKLNLTDTISRFFADFPNGNKITIYQLLSHTSGIPNWWEGEMPKDEPKDFPMCKQPHLYLQKMKTTSFFEPGTKHCYSNSGYVLLGEIIEIVSGMSYGAYLKKYIFSKANMNHTEIEYAPSARENWVKGYKQNSPTDTSFSDPDVYAMPFAAGALRSNAVDMINFLDALYNGKLIKKSTLELMIKYAETIVGIPVYDALFFPNNFTPPPPPDHIKKYGYGLGFNLMEIYNKPIVWHSGGIAGFNSILVYIPGSKTKIILLSNTENGIMPIWDTLQKEIVKFI
jgi:D-alanyl-D-alanine carboxypeptidase